MRKFRHRPGIALIIVLSVILALMLIATPFVVSMIAHERSSKAYVTDARADLIAEWARTAAVSYLYNTNDWFERRSINPTFQTYTHDPAYELTPDIRYAMPDAPFPRDVLAGLSVQDEQGKVNLRTAPPALVQNLRALAVSSGRPMKDFATLYSGRDSPWDHPQRVRDADGSALWVDAPGNLSARTRVRICKTGLAPFFTEIVSFGLNFCLLTNPSVPPQYKDGILEREARHPVNVLTAPREVLISLLQDLQFNVPDAKPIGAIRAGQVADALQAGAPTSMSELSAIVWGLTSLTDDEKTVIMINATDPGSMSSTYYGPAQGGTMPFCFRSYDTFTIESTGAVIRGPGAPASTRSWRDVVALSPPHPLEWVLESQWDFQYFLDAAAIGSNSYLSSGAPTTKLRTIPNATGDPDETLGGSTAGFTIRHADDLRGSVKLRESFPTEVEGKVLGEGDVQQYAWSDVFTPYQGAGDILAGGFEMWFRFTDTPQVADLFKCQEAPCINRLSLTYDGGFLTLAAADATLETIPVGNQIYRNGYSRIRVPFRPETDRWYHVAAYWKGTKFAQLCLMIDGFVPPRSQFEIVTDQDSSILTELSATAAAASTTVNLKNSAFVMTLPSDGPTPIEIGREVVVFDPATGTWQRGARGTTAADHPQGAKAALFGYVQKVSAANGQFGTFNWTIDRITVGGGSSTYAFGTGTNTSTAADVTAADTDIVAAGTITNFPKKGYLLLMSQLGQEVVFYDSIVGSAFQNVARAQQGTSALDHPQGSAISLYSVAVDNLAGYLDPCIFQIDNEWFIGRKDAVRVGYFIGPYNGTLHFPIPRGICGSPAAGHAAGARVIPVFAADRYDYTAVSDVQAGPGDRVTVVDGSDNREAHRIRRQWHPDDPLDPYDVPGYQLLAFDDWVSREYLSTDGYARLLKFPSGELLSQTWLSFKNPTVDVGRRVDEIDEIKVYANPKGDFYALAAVNLGDQACTVNASGSMSQRGGAIKIGDEILGYSEIQNGTLQRVKRGYLGSLTQVHDAGDRAFHLTGMLQIASLTSSPTSTESAISLSQDMTINPEGYLLIDEEVVGYHAYNPSADVVSMPTDSEGRGLWRGRFGTTPAIHAQGTLAYAIPFRYWDTYAPDEWDERMAVLPASRTVRGATWRDLTFEFETEPAADPNVIPHVRTRAGARALWTNVKDVVETTTPQKPLTLNKVGDTLDVQVLFEYAEKSYYPNQSWKARPVFRKLKAGYDAPTQTLYHEE